MKTYTVELNRADIAILTDFIIDASKKCSSVVTAEMNLELINKIQAPLKG